MTVAVAVVAVLVLACFVAGTTWNVRTGRELLRWMQGGLPLLGERTTLRWLGSTAVEMVIRKARPPFEQVTLVIFLEPRDVPWMWALSRWRGRRDTLIIRGRLRRSPQADLEALDRASWSGRDALRGLASAEWLVREPSSPGSLPIYHKAPSALPLADALLGMASRAGLTVRRLSLRRAEPLLEIHVAPPAAGVPAGRFFEAIRALGERAPV